MAMPTQQKSALDSNHAAKAVQPPWMHSQIDDAIWIFTRAPDLGRLSFSLHQDLGNGFYLDDPSHSLWRDSMNVALERVGATHGYGIRDGSTMYYHALHFVAYFRWLVQNNFDVQDVTPEVADLYAKHCSKRLTIGSPEPGCPLETEVRADDIDADESDGDQASNTSHETLANDASASTDRVLKLLNPLIHLWEARDLLPFELGVNPFPNGAHTLAKTYGSTRQNSSPLIPLEVGAAMLRTAIVWLEQLGPLILKAQAAPCKRVKVAIYREIVRAAKIAGINFDIDYKGRERKDDSLPVLQFVTITEKLLPHAFFVVISSLTLARPGEISGLEAGCISGTEESGQWAARYIEKNYRQTRSSPVHPTIARGILLFEELYRARRLRMSSKFLLAKQSKRITGRVTLKAFDGPTLDLLAALANLPMATDSASNQFRWNFTPRQFRRFAAVLWANRFELPVAALSVAMFHFDFVRTSVYLANADFIEWSTAASRVLTSQIVESVAAGSMEYAGQQSERLKRLTHRLRTSMRASTEAPEKTAARIFLETGIVAKPNAWGYCFCGSGQNHIRRARCLNEGVGAVDLDGRPNSEASSPGICSGCRFLATHKTRLPYLTDCLEKTIAVATSPSTSSEQRALAAERQKNLAAVVDKLKGHL
ncbi:MULTISPECIES: hypothetical protein [unclassified Roseateles]|uniref:hypothetical protein n=1 Tax=unclassified Roseateles TaxID=2626991 RepID=UPI000B229BA5|nr:MULTISPECIES: hypothetical protein [unclassified Roseateles]